MVQNTNYGNESSSKSKHLSTINKSINENKISQDNIDAYVSEKDIIPVKKLSNEFSNGSVNKHNSNS
jgi:hypothetical protein